MNGYGIKDACIMPLGREDIPAGAVAFEGEKSGWKMTFLHMDGEGRFSQSADMPDLKEGEGFICYGQGFYVTPMEITADFLKSATAREWIEYIAVRQLEKLHFLDPHLFVYAERT